MKPSWHQNRSKIDAKCEKRFFDKSCSRCSGGSILKILGVEVGSKNRLKINLKMKSTREGILASIFDRFCWILRAKLGGKIEPRSMQKGIEKTIEKRTAFGKELCYPPTQRGGRVAALLGRQNSQIFIKTFRKFTYRKTTEDGVNVKNECRE